MKPKFEPTEDRQTVTINKQYDGTNKKTGNSYHQYELTTAEGVEMVWWPPKWWHDKLLPYVGKTINLWVEPYEKRDGGVGQKLEIQADPLINAGTGAKVTQSEPITDKTWEEYAEDWEKCYDVQINVWRKMRGRFDDPFAEKDVKAENEKMMAAIDKLFIAMEIGLNARSTFIDLRKRR